MSTKALGAIGAVVLIAFVATIALVSGGGDDNSADANQTDGAFLVAMAPHHETAIEMAEMARERAQHPEVKQLAQDIVTAQSEEIASIEAIHQRLFGQPLEQGAHGHLGLDSHMAGMDMDMDALDSARPFDREFIDQMIPHHQGAIRMARIELAEGQDEETRDLAQAIITAQSGEIEAMNAWREEWYGAPSPAGGVPRPDEATASDDGMDSMSGMGH